MYEEWTLFDEEEWHAFILGMHKLGSMLKIKANHPSS